MNTTYQELANFLCSRDIDKYAYIVSVAKRCFNICYHERKNTGSSVCTSDLGIFTYVEDIAKQFKETNEFPYILYEDDFLIHGEVMRRSLERLISKILLNLGYSVDSSKGYLIRKAFLKKVDIYVYIANSASLIMAQDIKERVHILHDAEMPVWHRQSMEIVREMRSRGICNLAGSIYAKISGRRTEKITSNSNWKVTDFSFGFDDLKDENLQVLCRWQYTNTDAVLSVRKVKHGEKTYLIPSVLHGRLDYEKLEQVSMSVFSVLGRHLNTGELESFRKMQNNCKKLKCVEYCVNVLDMLIGFVLLRVFVNDFGLKNTQFSESIKRAQSFFGKYQFDDLLEKLCRTRFDKDDVNEIIRYLPGLHMEISSQNDKTDTLEDDRDILLQTSGMAYICGLKRERILGKKRFMAPGSRMEYRFTGTSINTDIQEFLLGCMGKASIYDFNGELISDIYFNKVIGALLYLYDTERINILNEEPRGTQNVKYVEQRISPTEMTLSLLPSIARNAGEEKWPLFQKVVYFCRLQNYSIREVLTRILGDEDKKPKVWKKLFKLTADYLDKNMFLDDAVIEWPSK